MWEELRFKAAWKPREGWKEAEDATALACLLSSWGIWMREMERKGASVRINTRSWR